MIESTGFPWKEFDWADKNWTIHMKPSFANIGSWLNNNGSMAIEAFDHAHSSAFIIDARILQFMIIAIWIKAG